MELKNKKVLVTGATGLIGSNLVDTLMREGSISIVVMGRNQTKIENTFAEYLCNDHFKVIEHDVAKPFPESLGHIDVIFHAAGPMERDIVLNKPMDVVLPNIIGSINCMEYARKVEVETGNKVRVVMFSSVTVYNNNIGADLSVTEDMTNCADSLDSPTISYSESKRMTEVIARAYCKQYGVDVVIARFSTVYGNTRNIPNTAFYEFIHKAWNNEEIKINVVGLPRRDNIYVDDAINGLILVAEKGAIGEAYNISCGGDKGNFASVDEIAQTIADVVAELRGTVQMKVIVGNGEPINIRRPGLILNNSKLKKLGWDIEKDLYQGIKETIKSINSK